MIATLLLTPVTDTQGPTPHSAMTPIVVKTTAKVAKRIKEHLPGGSVLLCPFSL